MAGYGYRLETDCDAPQVKNACGKGKFGQGGK